jgi:electron transfer flavoprotein-quinone oxidoreductase
VSEDEEIPAHVVIIAEGAMPLLSEKAGLREPVSPETAALGIKEVIKLPPEVIEDRFRLIEGEGAAQLFFGNLTGGAFGGGFVYTNRDTLSIGLVVGIESLLEGGPEKESHRLLEEFKERQEVASLVKGGELVEYSAHMIPEAAHKRVHRVYGNGLLLAGDAAGFTVNLGITVRGMEFALASGCLAAEAVLKAREADNFSASSLAHYDTLLKDSFISKDLETFKDSLSFLANPRTVTYYPELVCRTLEEVFWIDKGTKGRISSTIWKTVKQGMMNGAGVRDILAFRRL